MFFMAALAFSMACSVLRLMLADSMALICCSSVPICASVCSSERSCAFFRLSAALAAANSHILVSFSSYFRSPRPFSWNRARLTTCVVGGHVLAGCGVLIGNLVLQVRLALLQHIQLRAQPKDSSLGRVFAVLRRTAAAEPAPHDCVWVVVVVCRKR